MRRRGRDTFTIGEERIFDELEPRFDQSGADAVAPAGKEARGVREDGGLALADAPPDGGERGRGLAAPPENTRSASGGRSLAVGAIALGVAVLGVAAVIGEGESERESRGLAISAGAGSDRTTNAADGAIGVVEPSKPRQAVGSSDGATALAPSQAEDSRDREATGAERDRSHWEGEPSAEVEPPAPPPVPASVPAAAAGPPPQTEAIPAEPASVPDEAEQGGDFAFGTPVGQGSE